MRLLFILLILSQPVFSQTYDVLIQNGRILDGTGNSWYTGDIGVKDGKIMAIGKLSGTSATKTIDASELFVTPGFIDVHAHVEKGIFDNPGAGNYLFDGVTTVITGNCGSSADTLSRFFRRVDSMKTGINIASLVGHNTVRRIAMGLGNHLANAEEQQKMEVLVEEAMKEGAVGLSTGLIYLPGMYSNSDEVIGLAKVAAAYGGVYASHIRNEENKVTDAINEAVNIGRVARVPVEISHFKVSGPANWGRSKETLALIEKARQEDIDVTIDQYPYTASSTNLGTRLPDWALAGGEDSLKNRIKDPVLHKQIIEDMLDMQKRYKYKNYGYAMVAMYKPDTTLNGKSISEINRLKGKKSKMKEEAETILDMLLQGNAQMVFHSMNEEDVRYFMKYPFNMAGADAGVPVPGEGQPHPRAYGTNARILSKYVREEKIISLEEAVRRMTSLAAQKFHLQDRGLLKPGMAADILIFDFAEIADKATFEKPHQYSTGMHYVLVNGQVEIDNGKLTEVKNGTVLKGPGYHS